ncbi:MAG: hypothetical protein FJX34_00305, partial [Alphaproteobacteria bacterium]|nr:hypothetical protein [Alphaproteobacteria bacterium]
MKFSPTKRLSQILPFASNFTRELFCAASLRELCELQITRPSACVICNSHNSRSEAAQKSSRVKFEAKGRICDSLFNL